MIAGNIVELKKKLRGRQGKAESPYSLINKTKFELLLIIPIEISASKVEQDC